MDARYATKTIQMTKNEKTVLPCVIIVCMTSVALNVLTSMNEIKDELMLFFCSSWETRFYIVY